MDVNPKTKLKMDFQRQITTVAMQSPGVYTPGSPPRGQTQPILRRSSTLNSNNSFTADNGSTTALHPVKVKETIKKQVRHGSKLPIIIGGCLLLFVVNILVSMLAVKLLASGDHEMKMCVACATLVLGDEELDDYREYFHQSGFAEGKPKCCAKTTEQFQIMMGVLVKKGIRDEPIPLGPEVGAVVGASRTAVNMYAGQVFLSSGTTTTSNEYTSITGWTTTADVAFVRQGVEHDSNKGAFTVTQQGLYVVYSHLAFRRSPSNDNTEGGFIYSQKIVRENSVRRTEPEDLIVDTEVRICNEENFSGVPCYSSSIFSQLRLRARDEIYVQTLNPELLVADGKASYFGIFMIS